MKPLIKLENVWKIYQLGQVEFPALRGISLEINPGSFVVIMGTSGSGKSTLLNVIGALDTPTKGRVFWKGQDISHFSQDELAQIRAQGIGFVFQQFNLLPNFNAIENVMLPMVFQGVDEAQRKEQASTLLTSLDLAGKFFHRPTELSGGEQQRIAIARALANNPEVILADEPTGNLDSTTGKMILEILIDFHQKENKTIIVVTHDPSIAQRAEELVNIKDGQITVNHQTAAESLWERKI